MRLISEDTYWEERFADYQFECCGCTEEEDCGCIKDINEFVMQEQENAARDWIEFYALD